MAELILLWYSRGVSLSEGGMPVLGRCSNTYSWLERKNVVQVTQPSTARSGTESRSVSSVNQLPFPKQGLALKLPCHSYFLPFLPTQGRIYKLRCLQKFCACWLWNVLV